MTVRDTLLSIHILAVIVWLGCGLYELLLTHEIRRARDSSEEIPLIRIYGRYAPIVAIATLVAAAAGAAMSVWLGWGFFSVAWLGIKQGIMAAILLGMALLTPLFMKTFAAIASLSEQDPNSVLTARHLLARVERHVLLMRIGGVIAVLLAVWKPTF